MDKESIEGYLWTSQAQESTEDRLGDLQYLFLKFILEHFHLYQIVESNKKQMREREMERRQKTTSDANFLERSVEFVQLREFRLVAPEKSVDLTQIVLL